MRARFERGGRIVGLPGDRFRAQRRLALLGLFQTEGFLRRHRRKVLSPSWGLTRGIFYVDLAEIKQENRFSKSLLLKKFVFANRNGSKISSKFPAAQKKSSKDN